MAWEKLDHRNEGDRYIGVMSIDGPLPTYDSVEENSIAEDVETGAIYKFHDGEWYWNDSEKELDHNRAMLGLGLSYKAWHRNSLNSNEHAVYRFAPGELAKFHHAEMRLWRAKNDDVRFRIFRNHDISNLPAVSDTLKSVNQKGLPIVDDSPLIYTFHGNVNDADLSTILSGAIEVDQDVLFVGTGFLNTTPGSAALPSGRMYEVNTEYLVIMDGDNGGDLEYFYAYFYHSK